MRNMKSFIFRILFNFLLIIDYAIIICTTDVMWKEITCIILTVLCDIMYSLTKDVDKNVKGDKYNG